MKTIKRITIDFIPQSEHRYDTCGDWQIEGDTLIVDAKGFNDKTNVAGYHHTEDLHVVERYSRNPDGTWTTVS